VSAVKENPCRECSNELTNSASIALGIGPVCLKRERERAGEVKRTRSRPKTHKLVHDPNQLFLFPELEP